MPQTFDGVPHPCGFQGAGFDFVLTSSLQLLTGALFPLAIRKLLPQPCDQLWMRNEIPNMKPNEPESHSPDDRPTTSCSSGARSWRNPR